MHPNLHHRGLALPPGSSMNTRVFIYFNNKPIASAVEVDQILYSHPKDVILFDKVREDAKENLKKSLNRE